MPSSTLESTLLPLKNRYLGFLIWQSIQSAFIFLLYKFIILTKAFVDSPFILLLAFLSFILSMCIFSISIHAISTPHSHPPASPLQLALALLRFLFTASSPPPDSGFRRRAWVSLGNVLLVTVAALSGFLALMSIVVGEFPGSFRELVGEVGLRGFVVGVVYGLYYVFKRRWVLSFPVIQRSAFFSYKMGIPLAVSGALKLSTVAYLSSSAFFVLLKHRHKSLVAGWPSLAEQFIFYTGSLMVILSWELIQHLHKVLHTKRFSFAPPKGSAAAEANPSEPLLAALEESPPGSLMQYLAYLDLSRVSASKFDTWRRAAFFQETGETYKRIIAACLRPLEQLTFKLGEGLTTSEDSVYQLSRQLTSPDDIYRNPEILDSFNDFQLYAWCARAAASLTMHSHIEDRFGVAQLSGSHAAVLSTLLSCLLTVETFMGKKTNLQTANQMLGPAGIKWATNSTAKREISVAMNKKKDSPFHLKAYALADVLKVSIYIIVSEFYDEMRSSAGAGQLDKDWLTDGKPIYGSRDLLVQKLQFFLKFQIS